MNVIYLDHQATSPATGPVVEAMRRHLVEIIGNPHSADHAAGWLAADRLDAARSAVADALGASGDDLVFTSGATEADNVAILGAAPGVPASGRNRIVVSCLEHAAVLAPAREMGRRGFEVVPVPCGPDGVVRAEAFAEAVDERTLLASLMLVNNEVGTAQPVADVAERCREAGVLFHIDAAQALSWLPINVDALGCTSLAVSSHKIGGPMGIGALWIAPEVRHRLSPLHHGGEQEGGMRPGTVPGFLAEGFAQAVRGLPTPVEVEAWRERTVRLWRRMAEAVPGLSLNGTVAPRHPGNLNIRLPTLAADLVIAALQPGVALSQGSACTSGMTAPSHVLTAMGLTADEAGRSLRVSTAATTGEAELDAFAAAFGETIGRLEDAAAD